MVKEIQAFYEAFQNFSQEEQIELVENLHLLLTGKVVESDESLSITCPHCSSAKIRANGKNQGVQRYVCNGCNKNFSETTGKLLYNIKKPEKLRSYLFCMLKGYSLQKSANQVGISRQTSLNWRHKILSALQDHRVKSFSGILEVDECFFLESQKGSQITDRKPRKRGDKATKRGISKQQVAVIGSLDRNQNSLDFQVIHKGAIRTKDVKDSLKTKVEKVNVFCSDANHSYTAFAKQQAFQHKKLNASKGQRVKDRIYHIQNINNRIQKLRQWMKPFHGVSTKYLQNYLNWFVILEKIKNSTKKITMLSTMAIYAPNTIQQWKTITGTYLI